MVGIRIRPVLNFVKYETRSAFLIPQKKPLLLWTRLRNNSYPSSTNDGALSDVMRCINKYTFCTRASLCTWTSCLRDIKAFFSNSFVKSLNLSRNSSELQLNVLDQIIQLFYHIINYSRTSLIRTPKGQCEVSVLERCPYKGGYYDNVTFMIPLLVLNVQ